MPDTTKLTDDKWLNALKHFMGNGGPNQPVPFFKNADGSVNAFATLECAFGLYNVKPITTPATENTDKNDFPDHGQW